jgi:L-ascorbate metabolism protein UlaG (beta-lactamase superfamily)
MAEYKKVIPMHYNTFPPIEIDINEFKRYVAKNSSAECVILEPSQKIVL